MITQFEVKTLFNYKDGELYWKIYRQSNAKICDLAGSIHHSGYKQISINGKSYLAHRLIFLYHHGYLPKYIDHIDRNKLNNDINNLREVTQSQNNMNKSSVKGSSQYKGVCWRKRRNKWETNIKINQKLKYLESFNLEEDAAKAYNKAAIELFGEYAKLNEVK